MGGMAAPPATAAAIRAPSGAPARPRATSAPSARRVGERERQQHPALPEAVDEAPGDRRAGAAAQREGRRPRSRPARRSRCARAGRARWPARRCRSACARRARRPSAARRAARAGWRRSARARSSGIAARARRPGAASAALRRRPRARARPRAPRARRSRSATCSSKSTPSSSAPWRTSSRLTAAAKLGCLSFFLTDLGVSPWMPSGRTSAQATRKPDSSSTAYSVCSSGDSRETPRKSACEAIARTISGGCRGARARPWPCAGGRSRGPGSARSPCRAAGRRRPTAPRPRPRGGPHARIAASTARQWRRSDGDCDPLGEEGPRLVARKPQGHGCYPSPAPDCRTRRGGSASHGEVRHRRRRSAVAARSSRPATRTAPCPSSPPRC